MARKQQNETVDVWGMFRQESLELESILMSTIYRDTFSSGIFFQQKLRKGDPMFGEDSPPSYGDSTGELAISKEQSDAIHGYVKFVSDNILKASDLIHDALNTAKTIQAVTPVDAVERAHQTFPDCSACGDPVLGKLFYGRWDDKCRKRFGRWVEDGNLPDEKLRFETMVRNERK